MIDFGDGSYDSAYHPSRVIQELAFVADKALVTGDYRRCVAIVENIYDLLDRQSQAAPAKRSGEFG